MKKNLFDNQNGIGAKKITVYNMQYIGTSSMDWIEMFDGYDEMYSITYSSSISFMRPLYERFSYCETIFGYPEVMSKTQRRLSSLQLSVVKAITSSKDVLRLVEMMENKRVRMFVSDDIKSHEKLFILKGKDKYRVITGSANMSYSAFNGVQREIICVMEGKEAFDEFMKLFNAFKEQCTSSINPERIKEYVENGEDPSGDLGNAPVFEDVLGKGKPKEFEETEDTTETDNTYFDIDEKLFGDSGTLKNDEFQGKPQRNNGYKRYYITPESARKAIDDSHELEKKNAIIPCMDINYEQGTICIGSHYLNLNPDEESIRKSVKLVQEYFQGWDIIKNSARLKQTFWKILVWYFASPFIPHLRYIAETNGRDINFKYPTFILLYGDSNCGKTKFLEFLTRIMTGKIAVIMEGTSTTASKLRRYKQECKNLPLNIDEITSQRFNSYRSLIKEDNFGRTVKLDSYAPIALISNDVVSVSLDIRKRCIVFRLDASMEFSDTIANDSFVQRLDAALNNTALFREYARRMFPEVNKLVQNIENKADDPLENILNKSSVVLKSIFEEHSDAVCDYIRELSLAGDYFDAMEMGFNARETLKIGLKIEPELFTVDYKENLLVYNNPNYDTKKLQNICRELPVSWEAKVGMGSLAMNLEEAAKALPLDKVINRKGFKRSGIDQLSISLKVEPQQFDINEKENLLIFKTLNGDITRLIDIQKELPLDWEASLTLNSLAVNLDKAKEYLDLSTIKSKGIIQRFIKKLI